MKKNGLSLALLAAALLVLPPSAHATPLSFSIGNIGSGFVSGQIVTSAAMLAAQSASPAPFHVSCGSDTSSNCNTSWTFSYSLPVNETVTAASLSLGLSDIDSAATGNQVALYQ